MAPPVDLHINQPQRRGTQTSTRADRRAQIGYTTLGRRLYWLYLITCREPVLGVINISVQMHASKTYMNAELIIHLAPKFPAVIMLVSWLIAVSFLATASAAPSHVSELKRQGPIQEPLQVIADGRRVRVGTLPTWNFQYRSAGYLARGGCPLAEIGIKLCYQYKLSSDPRKHIDPGASSGGNKVQTVILNSQPYEATGAVTQFNFKLRVDASLTSTSSNSFPLVQIVSKEVDNGPASTVYFDVRNNLAGIYAFSDNSTPAVSIPLSQFTNKTTFHTWTVKGGPNGYADIRILEAGSGATVLYYRAEGQNSRDSYRFRVGAERLAENLTPLTVYWGDYSATPLQG